MVEAVPLPASAVDVDGNAYQVTLDPRDVPDSLISETGLVNFEILVQDPDAPEFGMSGASARAVVDGGGLLTWADPLAPMVGESSEVGKAAAEWSTRTLKTDTDASPVIARVTGLGIRGVLCVGESCAPTRGGQASDKIDLSAFSAATKDDDGGGDTPGGSVVIEDPEVTPGGSCPPGGAGDVYGVKRRVSTTVGTAYPWGDDTAWMDFTQGSADTYTATAGVGYLETFSWSEVSTETVERAGGFSWDPKSYNRSFRVGMDYRRIRHFLDRCPGESPYFVTWEPEGLNTGGYGENKDIDRADFNHCYEVTSDGIWWRQISGGTNYKYGSAVKLGDVIGIDLRIERAYNREAKLAYHISAPKHMCGDTTTPSVAGKVLEQRHIWQ